jgi:hypothetical protein
VKNYVAYLSDKKTFVGTATLTIRADGYLTALYEAQRLCASNHENLYVASVKET